MIINFSIENFGPIKENQELSFEADKSKQLEEHYIISTIGGLRLLKLGLIYGANASGKTTILKALDFLRDLVLNPQDKKTDVLNFTPFLFDAYTPHKDTKLSIGFIQNDIRYYYTLVLNKKAIVKEELYFYNPNKASVFKRTTDAEMQFTQITFGSKIKGVKTFEKALISNTLWNNTVLGGFLKTNMELKELKDATDWFSIYLKPLIYSRTDLENYVTSSIDKTEIKKEDVVNILAKADLNISDILIRKEEKNIPGGFIDFIENQTNVVTEQFLELKRTGKVTSTKLEFVHRIKNNQYILPFDLESQGTMRYYGFAGILSILIRGSVVFPIDELEASLHPDLYLHFLLSFLLNSTKSQIIATTHNREVLTNKDLFRNDVIWFTDKSENGATELYSLSDFDSSVIRDTSSIYNAYKIGKLGAVPHLGDYIIDIDNETK